MDRNKSLLLAVSILVSVAGLAWVFSGSELRELPGEIRSLRWGWIAVAVVADILVYVFQGWRWSLLLTPVAQIPTIKSVRAIYVGLFANELLPFRIGEAIRCYLQSRWGHIPLSVVAASAIIERVFDGVWLVLGLYLVVHFIKEVPPEIVQGGSALTLVVLVAAGVLFAAMLQKRWALRKLSTTGWQRHVRVLIEDLNLIGFSKYLIYSALSSLPYLLMQIVPVYATMQAYDLEDVRWSYAAAITIILRLGSAVPQAPGNLGLFQALAALGLTLFGYDTALAKRFSLVLWGVVTLPLLVAGSIAFAATGAKLSELKKHAEAFTDPDAKR